MHPLVVFSIVDLKNIHSLKSLELCFIQLEYLGLQTGKAVSQVNHRELL